MLGRDRGGRTRAQLAELVGIDDGDELRPVGAKEENDEARTLAEAGVDLRPGVAELEIGRGHHGKRAVLEGKPVARPVLDRATRHPAEARLDRVDGRRRRQQLGDVLLR